VNSKQSGNQLENEVSRLLNAASIPHTREDTIKGKRKGSVDFILDNPKAYIECKRYTSTLSFKYDSEDHDIKWSQLIILFKKHLEGYTSGLIVQESIDNRLYFIHIKDFMTWWITNTKKSLNLLDVQRIGSEIGNIKELVGE